MFIKCVINHILTTKYVTLVCGFFLNDTAIIIVQQVVKRCVMKNSCMSILSIREDNGMKSLEFPLLRMRSMCMNGCSDL